MFIAETSSPVEPEKAAAQQQLKPSRSQTSTPSSLMKGLTRSTASNRVNLSSDVLKVKSFTSISFLYYILDDLFIRH